MELRRCLYRLWVLLALAASISATTDRQFRQFWPGSEWEPVLAAIVNSDCVDERDLLFADPSRGGYSLVACILEYMNEARKAEMAICSVILGLLPLGMQRMGPKICDISILGRQRPVLTLLLCIGAPTATLTHEVTRMEPTDEVDVDLLWPECFSDREPTAKMAISSCEYLLALCSAGNAIYHGYLLTFDCVVLVSTLTGSFGHLPEAFAPLLWILLPIIIQALGLAALSFCGEAVVNESAAENTPIDQSAGCCPLLLIKLKRYMIQELTPCAFIKSAHVPATKYKFRPSYLLLFLNWLIKIGSWMHVFYGTIVLSSIMFLNMFDTLKVVGLLLGGTLVCRIVVAFELYGLQVAALTNQPRQATVQQSVGFTNIPRQGVSGHEMVQSSGDRRTRNSGRSTW